MGEEVLRKRLKELEKKVKSLEESINDRTIPKDELFLKAVEISRKYEVVSAPLFQRLLGIGYARSARMIDELEKYGIVGPSDKSGVRKVLNKQIPS